MSKNLSTTMPSSITVLLPPLLPVTENDHGAWVIFKAKTLTQLRNKVESLQETPRKMRMRDSTVTVVVIITILATTVTVLSRIRILRGVSWSDSTLFLSCGLYSRTQSEERISSSA
jgi:hypothetical protein